LLSSTGEGLSNNIIRELTIGGEVENFNGELLLSKEKLDEYLSSSGESIESLAKDLGVTSEELLEIF
jgi:hypothetical protein